MLAASTMAGEAVGPVVTVAGEQPHARAVAVEAIIRGRSDAYVQAENFG
jgi:hypothetical protein